MHRYDRPTPTRRCTKLLMAAVDDGVLSADAVLNNLLGWLSEDDVREFAEREYSELFEEEEEDDDDDDDGDDDGDDDEDSDDDDDDDDDKITIAISFEVIDPGGEEQDPEVISMGFCSENDKNYPVSLDTVFTENGQEYRFDSPRWAELAGIYKKFSQKEGMDEIRRLLREHGGEWDKNYPHPGDCFYTYDERDIRTGQTTRYGFHFEGLTPEQWFSLRNK